MERSQDAAAIDERPSRRLFIGGLNMGPALYLLTLITGQAAGTPSTHTQPYPQGFVQPHVPNGNCNCQQGQQPSSGLFGRVRGWFRGPDRCAERPGLVNRFRDRYNSDDPHYAHNGYPQGSQRGQVMPPLQASQHGRPTMDLTREPELFRPVSQTTNYRQQQTARTESRLSPINPKFVNKIGHEDDYSWITGQLDQENGRWLIRYATPETVDRYHGQIFLAQGANVTQLRPGDLVSATGQLVGQGGSVYYRVATINLIERD
jgi:hypothetical protein